MSWFNWCNVSKHVTKKHSLSKEESNKNDICKTNLIEWFDATLEKSQNNIKIIVKKNFENKYFIFKDLGNKYYAINFDEHTPMFSMIDCKTIPSIIKKTGFENIEMQYDAKGKIKYTDNDVIITNDDGIAKYIPDLTINLNKLPNLIEISKKCYHILTNYNYTTSDNLTEFYQQYAREHLTEGGSNIKRKTRNKSKRRKTMKRKTMKRKTKRR